MVTINSLITGKYSSKKRLALWDMGLIPKDDIFVVEQLIKNNRLTDLKSISYKGDDRKMEFLRAALIADNPELVDIAIKSLNLFQSFKVIIEQNKNAYFVLLDNQDVCAIDRNKKVTGLNSLSKKKLIELAHIAIRADNVYAFSMLLPLFPNVELEVFILNIIQYENMLRFYIDHFVLNDFEKYVANLLTGKRVSDSFEKAEFAKAIVSYMKGDFAKIKEAFSNQASPGITKFLGYNRNISDMRILFNYKMIILSKGTYMEIFKTAYESNNEELMSLIVDSTNIDKIALVPDRWIHYHILNKIVKKADRDTKRAIYNKYGDDIYAVHILSIHGFKRNKFKKYTDLRKNLNGEAILELGNESNI